ncbi:sulfatase-like hydrolase/transferase [Gammaproteobacteria bacterium]|nr:sulfatase-like hydrolase/transferase [Gammaproteobacteria bacterium]
MKPKIKNAILYTLATLAKIYVACTAYVFLEWMFFATKPSILSYYTTSENLSIFFLLPLFIFLSLLPAAIILILSDLFLLKRFRFRIVSTIPAFIYASIAFLLLDNFTNTMFGIYSGSFQGAGRFCYLAGYIALFSYFYWKSGTEENNGEDTHKLSSSSLAVLVCFTIALVCAAGLRDVDKLDDFKGGISSNSELPNILILSSDGINDRNTSAFGYERNTTPFIKALRDKTLVSTNHFSNSAFTGASVISLLTGKLPATTHVIYQPDGLRGVDAYEHLPGILKKLGYINADISIRYYADTLDMNLLDGFDEANGRGRNINHLFQVYEPVFSAFSAQGVFLRQILDRLYGRLLHILGVQDLEDAYELVTRAVDLGETVSIDDERIAQLYDFIDRAVQPFFLHVHLLGTHGPRFMPKQPRYSAGQTQNRDHMRDFYDDAIRDFDQYVEDTYAFLEEKDLLDNTLVIITSDHSRNPNVGLPIPLLLDFPGDERIGIIRENTQRIDLAPTILDFIGADIPEWMEGRSLLRLNNEKRLLFAYGPSSLEYQDDVGFSVSEPRPPFFTLNNFYAINCDRIYQVTFNEEAFKSREIPDLESACAQSDRLTLAEVGRAMVSNLGERGYDTSSLDWLLNVTNKLERTFSRSTATLENDVLYIPAIEYQGTVYAAVLKKNGSGNYTIDYLSTPLNNTVVATFDSDVNLFRLEDVSAEERLRNFNLVLIGTNPPVFGLVATE